MTARDLITRSMRLIGVLASDEPLGASEATDGLSALNDMLDSWSTERLLIPNKVRESFHLIANQKAYTMGTGGDFDTSRPIRIENALIQIVGTTPALELPIKILTKDQYAGIMLKDTTTTYPLYMYPDGAYPLQSLNVWPVPTDVNNLILYTWKPLADLASLDTALSLPPGYYRALRYNFAMELAPEYGRGVPDIVLSIAAEAKANIKRINFEPKYLMVDDALRAKPGVWNWMTGEPT